MENMRGGVYLVLLLLVVLASTAPVLGFNGTLNNSTQMGQTLDIYLNKEGKAFVIGYVPDIKWLQLPNYSHYNYQNNTSRFDGCTDAFTHKDGDLWTVKFDSHGHSDVHLTFHLPQDIELKNITVSNGLQYFISASNETLIADVQGHNVLGSSVNIKYKLDLPKPPNITGNQMAQGPQTQIQLQPPPIPLGPAMNEPAQYPGGPSEYPPRPLSQQAASSSNLNGSYLVVGFVILLIIGFAAVAKKKFQGIPKVDIAKAPLNAEAQEYAQGSVNLDQKMDEKPAEESPFQSSQEEDAFSVFEEIEPSSDSDTLESTGDSELPKIEISSEMKAIMDMLTNNERIVVQALIDSGGRLAQAELRHRTEMAKSSLSGILLSLKNRKLINKIECGHTNVVELSERFLSKKEQS